MIYVYNQLKSRIYNKFICKELILANLCGNWHTQLQITTGQTKRNNWICKIKIEKKYHQNLIFQTKKN